MSVGHAQQQRSPLKETWSRGSISPSLPWGAGAYCQGLRSIAQAQPQTTGAHSHTNSATATWQTCTQHPTTSVLTAAVLVYTHIRPPALPGSMQPIPQLGWAVQGKLPLHGCVLCGGHQPVVGCLCGTPHLSHKLWVETVQRLSDRLKCVWQQWIGCSWNGSLHRERWCMAVATIGKRV